jgi:hypothetical protein
VQQEAADLADNGISVVDPVGVRMACASLPSFFCRRTDDDILRADHLHPAASFPKSRAR